MKCKRSTYYCCIGRQVQSLNWIFKRKYRKEVSTYKSVLPSKIKDFRRYINTEAWYFSSELILLIGAHSIELFADETYNHMILPQRTVQYLHKWETAAQIRQLKDLECIDNFTQTHTHKKYVVLTEKLLGLEFLVTERAYLGFVSAISEQLKDRNKKSHQPLQT